MDLVHEISYKQIYSILTEIKSFRNGFAVKK